MLQAVIFDFDGVIADSEPLHLHAYQAVLQSDGIDLDEEEYYARYLGFDDVAMFQTLAKDRRIHVDGAKIDHWIASKSRIVEEMLSRDSILFPGAAAAVRMFADKVPLAIASGALEPEIAIVLEQAGLRNCFAAIASASDGVRGKPEPDLYLLAMAKLREKRGQDHNASDPFNPAFCIAIEDSRWGLEAARKAGLRCVAVTHTYEAAALQGADLIVEHLSDLTLAKVEEIMRDNGRAG
jgi:beta-phosphoglucomutase